MSNIYYANPEFSISSLLEQERSGAISVQEANLLSARHFDGLRQDLRANTRKSALAALSVTDQVVVIASDVSQFYSAMAQDIVTEPLS